MTGRNLKDAEVPQFLDEIAGRTEPEDAHGVARTIHDNKGRIVRYIWLQRRDGREELARHYEDVVERRTTDVTSYGAREALVRMRNFRGGGWSLSRSLTFDTDHSVAKAVGYALALAALIGTIWLGFKAKEYIHTTLKNRIDQYYNQANDQRILPGRR